MASPTQWTWVWVNSRSWWWTGRPGVLQFMGSQRVGHDWATELNWGIGPLLKFPHLLRAGPVHLTLLFSTLVPLSYRVLHCSIYFFPLVRYSWWLSAGFCMHFWIWRCIPDGSLERDVLHIHLLLCHLLYSTSIPAFIFNLLSLFQFYFTFASLPRYILA